MALFRNYPEEMKKFFWSSLFILSSCSVYKSQGRKDFETNSPTQIRTLSLMFCSSDGFGDILSSGETREWDATAAGRPVQIYTSPQGNSATYVALESNTPEMQTCLYQSEKDLHSHEARLEVFQSIDGQQP